MRLPWCSNEPDPVLCEQVMPMLREHGVEFRRGTSGGGNQLRQPYAKKIMGEREFEKYPARGSCAFLWLLHRQLPGSGKRKNS